MGSRKKNRSEAIKAAKKKVAMVHLRNCPTSPRKMRLMADLIRGMEVTKALYVLKHSSKEASGGVDDFEDSLKSARDELQGMTKDLELLNSGFESLSELTLSNAVARAVSDALSEPSKVKSTVVGAAEVMPSM